MNIQAALGEQSLGLDGGGKPLGRPVVQRLRWLSHGEFHIHLNGVALVGPDFCPVLAEGIPLLFITLYDFLQDVPVDGVFSADTRQQRIDIRPAVGVQVSSGLCIFLLRRIKLIYLLILVRSGVVSFITYLLKIIF